MLDGLIDCLLTEKAGKNTVSVDASGLVSFQTCEKLGPCQEYLCHNRMLPLLLGLSHSHEARSCFLTFLSGLVSLLDGSDLFNTEVHVTISESIQSTITRYSGLDSELLDLEYQISIQMANQPLMMALFFSDHSAQKHGSLSFPILHHLMQHVSQPNEDGVKARLACLHILECDRNAELSQFLSNRLWIRQLFLGYESLVTSLFEREVDLECVRQMFCLAELYMIHLPEHFVNASVPCMFQSFLSTVLAPSIALGTDEMLMLKLIQLCLRHHLVKECTHELVHWIFTDPCKSLLQSALLSNNDHLQKASLTIILTCLELNTPLVTKLLFPGSVLKTLSHGWNVPHDQLSLATRYFELLALDKTHSFEPYLMDGISRSKDFGYTTFDHGFGTFLNQTLLDLLTNFFIHSPDFNIVLTGVLTELASHSLISLESTPDSLYTTLSSLQNHLKVFQSSQRDFQSRYGMVFKALVIQDSDLDDPSLEPYKNAVILEEFTKEIVSLILTKRK